MPTLTTVDGFQITFAAKAVSALTDHDALSGEAVTCVYGVVNQVLRIRETVPAFLARLKIAKKFAQLTRANGAPVWINGADVSSVRAPLPGEYVAGVNAVVFTDSLTQGVRETPDAAVALLNRHGGEL
jgi:hypothetical protein